jgi:[ribosomal protein S18]-alanine N-acetyltransferase
MIQELHIRVMTDTDLEAVADLEWRSYQFPWSAGIFRDCLRVAYQCRVGVCRDQVIGYTIMSTAADEAHILNLCVDAAQRRQGFGRRMLEDLLESARGSGSKAVFLEVRLSNKPALELYHAFGFVRVGLRHGYYQAIDGREDAAVLRLNF